MDILLKSSAAALAAAALLIAAPALAYATTFASPANACANCRPFGAPPRLSAAMDISHPPTLAGDACQQYPAAHTSMLWAIVSAKFYWMPAPMFEVFDPLRLEIFDPRTGSYGVYAAADRGATPDSFAGSRRQWPAR
jgi:hypothetical protein